MDDINIKYVDGKIVNEYSEAEIDAKIVYLQTQITSLQATLTSLQAVKASII